MPYTLHKLHVLGNDFILIDALSHKLPSNLKLKTLADRHLGLGCDQILLLEPSLDPNVTLKISFFNQDTSAAEQCGNGLSAAAFYAVNYLNLSPENFIIASMSGLVSVTFYELEGYLQPIISLEAKSSIQTHVLPEYNLDLYQISMGNPHGICFVQTEPALFLALGEKLAALACFRSGANISFAQILDRGNLNLRVYERGVGPSLACGSAAAATAYVAYSLDLIDQKLAVHFEQGILHIDLQLPNIYLQGPATYICEIVLHEFSHSLFI